MRTIGAHLFPIVALAGTVLAILFHAPGGMSTDSLSQLLQARNGVYSDSHPPIMAILWRWIDILCPGPLGMLVVQIGALALAIYLLLNLFPAVPGWVKAPGFLVALFWPGYFFIIGAIWKDIAMVAAASLGLALVVRYLPTPRHARSDMGVTIAVILLLFYAIAVRFNAAPAIIPIIALLFWQWLPHHPAMSRLIRSFVGGTVVVSVLFALATSMSAALVTSRSNFWQILAMYDLVGISVALDQNVVPLELYPAADMAEMKKNYTPRSVAPLTQASKAFPALDTPEKLASLRTHWFGEILRHPLGYLRHRWRVARQFFGLSENGPYVGVYSEGVMPNGLGIAHVSSPWREQILMNAQQWAVDSLVFRPWAYMVAAIVILLAAWWARLRSTPILCTLLASSVLNFLGLFFIAPSSDYRYSIITIVNAVLMAVMAGADALSRLIEARSRAAVRDRSGGQAMAVRT